MSSLDVQNFYRKLEEDTLLRSKAMALKDQFPDQEQLLDAFCALGSEQGFHFSTQELVAYIFSHGKSES